MTERNSRRFVDILDSIVSNYNNSYHRTINMSPNETGTTTIFQSKSTKRRECKFQIGDIVRIALKRLAFEKGYAPGWSHELYVIYKTKAGRPPYYKIKDYKDELLIGRFYEEELVRSRNTTDIYKVERILKTRTRRGRKECLVRWLGWDSSHDSWEPETNIVKL